jgi:hypothetical protein
MFHVISSLIYLFVLEEGTLDVIKVFKGIQKHKDARHEED